MADYRSSPFHPAGHRLMVILALAAGPMAAVTCDAAWADDLPGLLLAASRLVAAQGGGTRCAAIASSPIFPLPTPAPPPATSFRDDDEYASSTRGAYLGRAEVGRPAGLPLLEALLEAGAATRHRMRVPTRVQVPNPVRGNGLPLWAEQVEERVSDVVVASGPDAAFFPTAKNMLSLGSPPPINGGVDEQGNPLNSSAVMPPGIWATDRICLAYVPVRLLEYGDVETRANGLRFVTAAILFRAERAPKWLWDARVTTSLYQALVTQEVRFTGFRDDGDGWRPTLIPDPAFIEKNTHLTADD